MHQNSRKLIKIKLIENMKNPFKQRQKPMFKGIFLMVGVARVELATNPLFKGVCDIGVQVVCILFS